MLIFLLCLEFYQNFKSYYAGKLNKTYLVNMFLITLKGSFLGPELLILP